MLLLFHNNPITIRHDTNDQTLVQFQETCWCGSKAVVNDIDDFYGLRIAIGCFGHMDFQLALTHDINLHDVELHITCNRQDRLRGISQLDGIPQGFASRYISGRLDF